MSQHPDFMLRPLIVAAQKIYETMVLHNLDILEKFPCPDLASSGVTIVHHTDDELADLQACLERGHGNIESLLCWRVAEMRRAGDWPRIVVRNTSTIDGLQSLAVLFPDGTVRSAYANLGHLELAPSVPEEK